MDVELVECSRCHEIGDADNMEECFEDILCKKCVLDITGHNEFINGKWEWVK